MFIKQTKMSLFPSFNLDSLLGFKVKEESFSNTCQIRLYFPKYFISKIITHWVNYKVRKLVMSRIIKTIFIQTQRNEMVASKYLTKCDMWTLDANYNPNRD